MNFMSSLWHEVRDRFYWGNKPKSKINESREIMVSPSSLYPTERLMEAREPCSEGWPSPFSSFFFNHWRNILMQEQINCFSARWSRFESNCLHKLLMNSFCLEPWGQWEVTSLSVRGNTHGSLGSEFGYSPSCRGEKPQPLSPHSPPLYCHLVCLLTTQKELCRSTVSNPVASLRGLQM